MKLQISAIFVEKSLKINMVKIKNTVTDHCHGTGLAHSVCNLKCSMPKEITTIFHNVSNYEYHRRANRRS